MLFVYQITQFRLLNGLLKHEIIHDSCFLEELVRLTILNFNKLK